MKGDNSIDFREISNEDDYLTAEINRGDLCITCVESHERPSVIYLSPTQAEQLVNFIRNELP